MHAVIQTGGKQYTVTKGDKILVDKLASEAGANIEFPEVLLVYGDSTKVGTPLVSGAKVTAKVVGDIKDKKVIVYKYKRRKGYQKTQGHRQQYTEIQIDNIIA